LTLIKHSSYLPSALTGAATVRTVNPDGPDSPRPGRRLRLAAGTLAAAIPTVAALALGLMFVMPSVFAAAPTSAASAWAGPDTRIRTSATTPTVQASTQTPAPVPSKAATTAPPAPAVTKAAPAVTKAAPAVTRAAPSVTKAAATRPANKPIPSQAAKKKVTSSPATKATVPTGPMVIPVNITGGQAAIDSCKGPVLVYGYLIAEHDGCGGTQWYVLSVGSTVTLNGSAVSPGSYKVTSIAQYSIGATDYVMPHPYALQTCIGNNMVRVWYLQPI